MTNLNKRAKNVVKFYNGCGTAEQWIKEGKNAVKWTKLSCRTFNDNQTRLQLSALAQVSLASVRLRKKVVMLIRISARSLIVDKTQ